MGAGQDRHLLFPGEFLVYHHDEYLTDAGLSRCLDAVVAGEDQEAPVGFAVAQGERGEAAVSLNVGDEV